MLFLTLSALMEYNHLCKLYEHVSIHAVADKYGIPYTTFWKCVTGRVMGTGYRSGGKGYSKIFSEGMFQSLLFLFFIFNLFFSFQCIPFARLYTGQCTFCCRTRERIGQTDSDIQLCRLSTVQNKKCAAWHISMSIRTK